MLFDLEHDREERHNVAAENLGRVAELRAKLELYKATGIPQATNDPKCPALPPFEQDPQVGPVWAPWCASASEVVFYT